MERIVDLKHTTIITLESSIVTRKVYNVIIIDEASQLTISDIVHLLHANII